MVIFFKLLDTSTIFNFLEFNSIFVDKISLMIMKNISKSFQKMDFITYLNKIIYYLKAIRDLASKLADLLSGIRTVSNNHVRTA